MDTAEGDQDDSSAPPAPAAAEAPTPAAGAPAPAAETPAPAAEAPAPAPAAAAADPEPVAGPSGLKRPAAAGGSAGGGGSQKKFKGAAERMNALFENGEKNAIMKLNELLPGLPFVVASVSGPVHSPLFTVTVSFNSRVFTGRGATKQQAKLNAAEDIWLYIQRRIESSSSSASTSSSSSSESSSAAGPSSSSSSSQSPSSDGTAAAAAADGPLGPSPATGPTQSSSELPMPKSPLALLNERKPGIRYEVVSETGQSHCKMYTVSVNVEGQDFTGTGQNKRLAKTRAARAAMETVFGCTFPPEPGASEQPMQSTSDQSTQQHQQQQHRMFGDVISELVLKKFSQLTNQHTTPHSRYKVIAGVVMTTNAGSPSVGARVVSLATGSKCVSGEFISIVGKTVNDLHAENLAIRGCRLFILKEMHRLQVYLKTGSGDPSAIIVQHDPTGEDVFRVKPTVKFHLFISSAPCGHARMISSHEQPNDDDGDTDDDDDDGSGGGGGGGGGGGRRVRARRVVSGRLRAKVESGEGTVAVSSAGQVQTWDGIVNGEKLLAMSCTDRITRWNVLGIQGSLLTHLMRPVYLDSIVIGRLYNNRHLKHAFYERIGHIGRLPADYRLNRPLVSPITHPGCRDTQKSPRYSCLWVDDGTPMEAISAARGRLDGGDVSKIAKSEFYHAFVQLMEYFGYYFWYQRSISALRMTYREMKAAARSHREAKVVLYNAFKDAGLGTWVHCPREQQEFTTGDH